MHRMGQSLLANPGFYERTKLFKHAVGKLYTTVKIGFRPWNPGSSAINMEGSKVETMDQITIDGMLLGPSHPGRFTAPGDENLPLIAPNRINFIKIDTEGYDVAVVGGMMRTILEGKVPHILIEFSPMDAQGTAGCDPVAFVKMMYNAGYKMYEFSYAVPLEDLVDRLLPMALSGKGQRVFEVWFVLDDAIAPLIKAGHIKPGVRPADPPAAA
jgi:hypothetical protein